MRKLTLITTTVLSVFFLLNPLYAGRYYIPEIGRFATPDPAADKYPSQSPYSYALNNPLRNIDPDGKQVIDATKVTFAIMNAANKFSNFANNRVNMGYHTGSFFTPQEQYIGNSIAEAVADPTYLRKVEDAASQGALTATCIGIGGSALAFGGAMTGHMEVAGIGLSIAETSFQVATGFDVASFGMNLLDASAYGGSWNDVGIQAFTMALSVGITHSATTNIVKQTGLNNTLFRSSKSGQFVTNRYGISTYYGLKGAAKTTGVGLTYAPNIWHNITEEDEEQ